MNNAFLNVAEPFSEDFFVLVKAYLGKKTMKSILNFF